LETNTEMESIRGQFQRVIMRDYQSGYTVFVVLTSTGPVTCTGVIMLPKTDVKVEVTGVWHTPASGRYGRQLAQCTVRELLSDTNSMREYLCTIPGLGVKTANELIEHFGDRLYSLALEDDAIRRITRLPSISEKRATTIVHYIRETQEQRKLFELISKHGGSYNACLRIYKEFGVNSVARLLEHPYEAGYKGGLSFEICDRIASSSEVPAYSRARITAAMMHVLRRKTHSGDTYVPHNELVKSTRDLLSGESGKDIAYTEAIAAAVINACLVTTSEGIIKEDKDVYLSSLYYQELRTAFAIRRLIRDAIPTPCDPQVLCAYAEKVCGVTYAEQQREAFNLLRYGGVAVITGGPGTGKTTLIKGFLVAFELLHPNCTIRLCAPTGRASQRMKEATGREATTVHRLLEYRPYGDVTVCKNEADPIEADLLVIDESSMVPIDLADLLFSAIKSGTTVILTGDIDQLPSVGAGNVLHDIIYSGCIPVVKLTKAQRQADGSLIIENAARIRDGISNLKTGEDFEIIECDDDTSIGEEVAKQFRRYYDPANVFSSQVLTPVTKRALVGSKALNNALQAIANPGSNSLHYADYAFRPGDKVMMTRNNYDPANSYFNGDIGTITDIHGGCVQVRIDKDEILLDEDLLNDLSLSYACTIHKSQGSEYDVAIVVLPAEPASMLQRNLLYTAITRAKKKVVLIAAKGAISKAVFTKDVAKRKSKLDIRLQGGKHKGVS